MAEPQTEKVVEYGVENDVEFVITETGVYPNISRKKYWGERITNSHKAQVEILEKEKDLKDEFEEFKKGKETTLKSVEPVENPSEKEFSLED